MPVGLFGCADPRVDTVVDFEEVGVESLDRNLELVLVDDQPDVHLRGALAEHQHLSDREGGSERAMYFHGVQECIQPATAGIRCSRKKKMFALSVYLSRKLLLN